LISDNLMKIRKQIADAAARSGRDPSEIGLLAVSKRVDTQKILEAYRSGQMLFGENYVQEAKEKIEKLDGKISWHFIGHLQSNKAKLAAGLFNMIETVDHFNIARILNRHAAETGKILDILVQVNLGGEQQKSGVSPLEAEQFVRDLKQLNNLRVRGLMTMPPYSTDPEQSRPFFRALKRMADRFQESGYFDSDNTVVLSMGMSGDFTIAIEEGATLVRVGTAIFGERTERRNV